MRMIGDLAIAEDAVQEACLAALARWPASGGPANPRGWLIGVARHKAIDLVRREARRGAKEEAAARELGGPGPAPGRRHRPPGRAGRGAAGRGSHRG
jgi:RNA polymerase sigma-70 factor, ECF subfamily